MVKVGFLDRLAGVRAPAGQAADTGGEALDGAGAAAQTAGTRRGLVVDETLARRLGWVPQEEWSRAPEKWEPLESFLDALPERAARYREQNASLKEQMRRTGAAAVSAIETARAEAREQARRELDAAIDSGDPDRTRAAASRLSQAEQGPPAEVRGWIERNPWFVTNPEANAFGQALTNRLAKEGKSTAEQLSEVERQAKRRFPELFDVEDEPFSQPTDTARQEPAHQPQTGTISLEAAAARKSAPQVQGGTRAATPTRRGGDRTFADIPATARKAFKETLARKGMTEEQYAKAYWASEPTDED